MFHAGGGDMDDMMSAFFGGGMGGMGGGGQRRKRKGQDVGRALPVSLEDLYNGKKVSIPNEKQVICSDCNGTGAKKGSNSGPCRDCKGQGVRVIMRPVGPGMVQQMRAECDACNGQGMKVSPQDRCTSCNMKRVKTIDSPLDVVVEKGMEHDQQIPFRGEGDQHPDIDIPGSIVIVLKQLKHDVFKRDGMDLHMSQKLTLAEALCGFQFTITHLDGRVLCVNNAPGEIIKPEEKKCLVGEGMPNHRNPSQKGDLVITFEVEFPTTMGDDAIEQLRLALPPPPTLDVDYNSEEAEHCTLTPEPLEAVRKEMERQAADDDDDDEGQGGGGVQCAHQ